MKITILTLFPEMFGGVLDHSILGRARAAGLLNISLVNIRDFSKRKHKNADDTPFGGGAGMVMLAQPLVDAIESATAGEPGCRILMSPRGTPFAKPVAERLTGEAHLVLVCGHYEGVDQRVIDLCIDEELSLGDYVLTGGELAAMVVTDAVARLLPGVLGSEESAGEESFSSGLLEYPHYTRPREYRGLSVPQVLLEGNHAAIADWRLEQSLRLTHQRRPELIAPWLAQAQLSRRRRRWVEVLLAELDR